MNGEDKDRKPLPKAVFARAITFVLAGFGFVAALAWNDAIQALFAEVFGTQGSLLAKFGYAAVVTIIITVVTIRLSRYAGNK